MVVISIVVSYLLGSLMFSVLIGKLAGGVDIRQHGSGNAGATNALRVLGIMPAVLIFVLDMSKGIAAVFLGNVFSDGNLWVMAICGLAAIAGHNWPVLFGFRGGKGIATTIGVVAMLSFFPALVAGIVAILSIVLTRYVSLGSLIFTALMPITGWIMGEPLEMIITMLIIFVFAFYRHRSNIVRLWKGQENKLGRKR